MTEQQRKEMEKMQNDAIRRMRDMNSKGTQNHATNLPPAPNFLKMNTNNSKQPDNKKEVPSSPVTPTSSKGFNLLRMLNLDNFKMDSDFTVIIAMILLLSSEESDEILLLALLYIML
ncbi:MAG: hypothetical protein IKV36_05245 [Clostridia bacterium]|nr:hypothetical protein [Clostridia bacterium]